MLYVDYFFDINDNIIIFDEEMTMGKDGNLPTSWAENDLWKLVRGANGNVTLIKVTNEGKL